MKSGIKGSELLVFETCAHAADLRKRGRVQREDAGVSEPPRRMKPRALARARLFFALCRPLRHDAFRRSRHREERSDVAIQKFVKKCLGPWIACAPGKLALSSRWKSGPGKP